MKSLESENLPLYRHLNCQLNWGCFYIIFFYPSSGNLCPGIINDGMEQLKVKNHEGMICLKKKELAITVEIP